MADFSLTATRFLNSFFSNAISHTGNALMRSAVDRSLEIGSEVFLPTPETYHITVLLVNMSFQSI